MIADMAVERGEAPRNGLDESRLALAVGAQNADAIIVINANVQITEDNMVVIAESGVFQPHNGRRHGGRGIGKDEGDRPFLDRDVHSFEFFERLEAALGLTGF